MQVKYTPTFLHKLENIFTESDYILRYEKGNFKSGYCVLDDSKIVVVNKYFTIDGKINCLIDIIQSVELNPTKFSEKSMELYQQIKQTSLKM